MTDSSSTTAPPTPLLDIQGLSKSFGALKALDSVRIHVTEGSIHGLIGPNGSGKTTLFDCVTGLLRPEEGRVLFCGRDITGFRPEAIARQGVRRTFQDARLVGALTVLENVMSGGLGGTGRDLSDIVLRLPLKRSARETTCAAKALELLDRTGMKASAEREASSLAWAERQEVQIVRALMGSPRLLLLDEPAAGMGINEIERMEGTIREVRAHGVTVLVVSHDVKMLLGICDRVTVLSFGKVIAEGPPQDITKDPRVLEAYLGES